MVAYLFTIVTFSTLPSIFIIQCISNAYFNFLSAKPTSNRLDSLPNEIHEIILNISCGVITLFAFTMANTQAQALFKRFPNAF